MAKKRKSDSTGLDEVDRTMHSTFCSAANSLSQLYTQAQNQQKLIFQAGERHGLEKLYQWILRQQEEGSRVTAADIFAYVQNELDFGGEEASMSPASQFQHHSNFSPHANSPNTNTQMLVGAFGQATISQGPRSANTDQTKNSVFSNALSSPVRRSLQPFHMAQGGYHSNNAPPGRRAGFAPDSDHSAFNLQQGLQGPQNEMCTVDSLPQVYSQQSHQNRPGNPYGSHDSSMDMHEERDHHEHYQ